MKRILTLLFFCLAIGLAAQEITGFQVMQENMRYKLSPRYSFQDLNNEADLYVFFRPIGSQTWQKAKTLLGRYRNLSRFNRDEYLYWDPVFDFQPWGDYEFKIYLVKLIAVNPSYDYNAVNSVGLLYGVGKSGNDRIAVNNYSFNSLSIPIALPVGSYQMNLYRERELLGSLAAQVEPFSYNEVNFDEAFGELRLTCSNPIVKFSVNGSDLGTRTSFYLPAGSHRVLATAVQRDSSYPHVSQGWDIVLSGGETKTHRVDLPTGSLNLRSNIAGISYEINGTRYPEVLGMHLSPGRYSILAYNQDSSLIRTLDVTIVSGLSTDLRFDREQAAEAPKEQAQDVSSQVVQEPAPSKVEWFVWLLEDISYFQAYDLSSDSLDLVARAIGVSGLLSYNVSFGGGNVNFLFSLGLLDRVYVPWDVQEKRVNPSFDIFSGGLGFRFSSFNKALHLDLKAKYSFGAQFPIQSKIQVDTVRYRFVNEFDEYDNEDGSKGRATQVADFYNALEVRGDLSLNLSRKTSLYAFGLLREQDELTGKWYRKSDIDDWENFVTDNHPSPVWHPNFPLRNSTLMGSTYQIGIGLRYRFWE